MVPTRCERVSLIRASRNSFSGASHPSRRATPRPLRRPRWPEHACQAVLSLPTDTSAVREAAGMHTPCCEWAEGLHLPELETKDNYWPYDVSQISVHLTRKYPLTVRTDTLLVKMQQITREEWDALHPQMRMLIALRLKARDKAPTSQAPHGSGCCESWS